MESVVAIVQQQHQLDIVFISVSCNESIVDQVKRDEN